MTLQKAVRAASVSPRSGPQQNVQLAGLNSPTPSTAGISAASAIRADANTQIVLAIIRSASASARLAANDLDAIGILLKAGWISVEDAAEELANYGLLERPPIEEAAA